MGRALFSIVAVFAQLRVDTIRDNTRRGLKHACAQGRLGDRPSVMSTEGVAAAVQMRALAMPRRRFEVSSALLSSQLVVSTSIGSGWFDPPQCVGNVALLACA
jgi:hypothetical protein